MVGPNVGPPTTATAYHTTAFPLIFGSHKSPNAALTLLTGALPKNPMKNLVTNTLAAFSLTANPIPNSPIANVAGSMLHRRPQISLRGPQMHGPKTKPSTKSEMVRTDTSWLTSM